MILGTALAAFLAVGIFHQPVVAQVGTSVLTKFITLTAASLNTTRAIYSRLTLSPTSNSVVIPASGSVAGLRGEINVASGKTVTDGFLYGVQGKGVLLGTMNGASALRLTGLIGQVDTTGGTLTGPNNQVSGVWADLQGNATVGITEMYPLRVSNGMSVSPPALGLFIGHATAALEVSDLGNGSSGDFVISASGTSAGQCAQTGGVVFTKTLKIVADGTTYYIGLCTAP